MLFKKLGIPVDRVRFVSVGGHSARLQAVVAGKAEAAIVNEVTGLIGERTGHVHIVASVREHFPLLGYIVLVAKTAEVHRRLSAALAQRRIRRLYAVLSWGHVSRDRLTVEGPIGRDPRDRKRMAIVTTGRSARTDFLRLARFDSADLLRARLSSGRTHQIRVHLASVGCPVLADKVYSSRDSLKLSDLVPGIEPLQDELLLTRQALHAHRLRFSHPRTKRIIEAEAPLPEEFLRALIALRLHRSTGR
jgi:23S rRNA pseudouridine1911/1915/1917 synthase